MDEERTGSCLSIMLRGYVPKNKEKASGYHRHKIAVPLLCAASLTPRGVVKNLDIHSVGWQLRANSSVRCRSASLETSARRH